MKPFGIRQMRKLLLAVLMCSALAACTGNDTADSLAQTGAIQGAMTVIFDAPMWP